MSAYAVVVDAYEYTKYWTTLKLCVVDVASGRNGPCRPYDNSGTPPQGDDGSTYAAGGVSCSWGKTRIM